MQKIRHDGTLGQNIRRLRMEQGMTQEEVAAQMQIHGCNVSRGFYAQIECGISNIKVQELAALARIFRTDFNAFFEGIS